MTQKSIMGFLDGRRVSLYPVTVSTATALLGFSLASLTFAVGYGQADRLLMIRDSGQLGNLFRVFTSTLWSFAVLLAAAVLALVFDSDARPNRLMTSLLAGAITLGILRIVRLLTVFREFVELMVTPLPRGPGEARPSVSQP